MPPQLEEPEMVVQPSMGSKLPDPDWSLLSPGSPLFKSKDELQQYYIKQVR